MDKPFKIFFGIFIFLQLLGAFLYFLLLQKSIEYRLFCIYNGFYNRSCFTFGFHSSERLGKIAGKNNWSKSYRKKGKNRMGVI